MTCEGIYRSILGIGNNRNSAALLQLTSQKSLFQHCGVSGCDPDSPSAPQPFKTETHPDPKTGPGSTASIPAMPGIIGDRLRGKSGFQTDS